MSSLRNIRGSDDSLLDAARHCILAVGWKRTTLTEVARRAGVSRMTLYRRWPDMQTLLADLMVREWAGVVADAAVTGDASPLERLARGGTRTVQALRENELFRKIVHVDPELLLPYLLDRRGRTQDTILGVLEALIVEGQDTGAVRAGDPTLLARSTLLASYGFAFSAETMTGPSVSSATAEPDDPAAPSMDELDAELHALIERYLTA